VPARHALEEGADVVIAIAIDKDIALSSELQTAVDIYVRAGEIQGFHLEQHDLECADLVIRPQLGGIHWADFSQSREMISRGEKAAIESLPEIRRLQSVARRIFVYRLKNSFKRLFTRRQSRIG
jgi:NTE family protein